mmetsp:Transcript_11777/g.14928  ORF Transcript_11777/g.14928 Transcript_11777/m.14928 type:complete len:133 (-) Transcript_11777:2124-2522(-)|eukprot:CAMPEP_0170462028 /NCGR_PEP_ID=MMETSP0123-20130129/7695_1 /TAXON_ID=182087 /ORGANISM="Favella ehrenbergii, Strain Fehren 1" /LENGTH=132 /DNA_ID=CAMNT_0010727161 /DNA_START=20 /DNA_END=418 /DNA_ORIENTATION=+
MADMQGGGTYGKKLVPINQDLKSGKEAFGYRGEKMKHGRQNIPEALYHFSKAISFEPVSAEIFNYRGKTLFMLGYFMEALMDFSVAIKMEKDRKLAAQAEEAKGPGYAMNAAKKFQLEEYYRNAGQANFELA